MSRGERSHSAVQGGICAPDEVAEGRGNYLVGLGRQRRWIPCRRRRPSLSVQTRAEPPPGRPTERSCPVLPPARSPTRMPSLKARKATTMSSPPRRCEGRLTSQPGPGAVAPRTGGERFDGEGDWRLHAAPGLQERALGEAVPGVGNECLVGEQGCLGMCNAYE